MAQHFLGCRIQALGRRVSGVELNYRFMAETLNAWGFRLSDCGFGLQSFADRDLRRRDWVSKSCWSGAESHVCWSFQVYGALSITLALPMLTWNPINPPRIRTAVCGAADYGFVRLFGEGFYGDSWVKERELQPPAEKTSLT